MNIAKPFDFVLFQMIHFFPKRFRIITAIADYVKKNHLLFNKEEEVIQFGTNHNFKTTTKVKNRLKILNNIFEHFSRRYGEAIFIYLFIISI